MPVWGEYGLDQVEYFLVKSALAAASRFQQLQQLQRDSSVGNASASACISGSREPRGQQQHAPLGVEASRVFARLMGYPSSNADIKSAFEEFGSDYKFGTLNDHQLLLWSSMMSHRRRAQLSFGLDNEQFITILGELHESAGFKKNFGVITSPHEVGYIRRCRNAATRLEVPTDETAPLLPPPSLSSATPLDTSTYKSIFNATRCRVKASGYPDTGILLSDVLEAFASEDDGFELCAASPRGESGLANAPLSDTPTSAVSQATSSAAYPQQPPLPYTPMLGGPYHALRRAPPPSAPPYAPLPPSAFASPRAAPYVPLTNNSWNAPPPTFMPPHHHQHHHTVGYMPPAAWCPPQPRQGFFGPSRGRGAGQPPPQITYYGMPPPPPSFFGGGRR
jgi:hypothetical protein